jgi:transposase
MNQACERAGKLRQNVLWCAMALVPADLPDDVNALKALISAMAEKSAADNAELAELKERNARADERIAGLTSIIKMLERARYGRRSEKLKIDRLNEEQEAFVFDEIKTGLEEIQAELDKRKSKAERSRPSRPRKGFAAHLERVEVVIEPELPAGCEGLEKVKIGEDVSERLDVTPAKFRVIVTRRPKYAYRGRDGVIQAPAPDHLIEAGIPTEALLAHIAVAKYADGLPLYRQEAIYARDQVELDRSLMAQWMGRIGFELAPLADAILDRIKQGERIFADETTLPTLAPGSGKVKTAWLWAYARDDTPFGGRAPPMVAYKFEDSRGGECVARHLAGYRGILQVDVCGRPGKCKQNLTLAWACGRVLTCVRPRKATSTRRGPLWNSWIGSNSARRALGTYQPNDSSDPASDRLPIILRWTSPHSDVSRPLVLPYAEPRAGA